MQGRAWVFRWHFWAGCISEQVQGSCYWFCTGGLRGVTSSPPFPQAKGGHRDPWNQKFFRFPAPENLSFCHFFFANLFKRITKNTNFGYFFLKKTSKFRKVLALHAELNTLFWDFFFGNTVGVPIAVQKR